MINPRKSALKVLKKVLKDGAYSNIALNSIIKEDGLEGRDSSFCSALVYGVLERKILLDYIIRQYTNIRLKKIESDVLNILRMGILQISFMDKIPESAVVNESVKLAKNLRLNKASGFINGVLRGFIRLDYKYKLPDRNSDKIKYYSVVYSVSESIVKLFLNSYGEDRTVDILRGATDRPPVTIRVNTLRITEDDLKKSFEKNGIKAEKVNWLENALILNKTGSIENTFEYQNGLFHVQDIASQLCCKILAPKENMVVYDVCSAPGGKSFTMAEMMNNTGKVYAFDMYEHKVKLIKNGAYRLGIKNISSVVRNALDKTDMLQADRVLCDVPCSGLGVLRRKPEIRYKENLGFNTLPEIQYNILCNSAKYVKKGGLLVYSTCTLNPNENEKNVERFLSQHLEFKPLKITIKDDIINKMSIMENTVTLIPSKNGTDGFFISVFERMK